MVKVFYEPPPFGPQTSLNRGPYGSGIKGAHPFIQKLSSMPQGKVIAGAVVLSSIVAYLPLSTFVCMSVCCFI
jgi:hypothetical protein